MRVPFLAFLFALAVADSASASGLNFGATTVADMDVVAKLHPQPPPPSPPGSPPPLRYYPEKAQLARQEGHATLRCYGHRPDGSVSDCRLIEETPQGWGFGDAAMGIVRVMHLAPEGGKASDKSPEIAAFAFRMEASPTHAAPRTILKPVWSKMPSTEDMLRLVSRGAPSTKAGDWAFVECQVNDGGAFEACAPLTEEPLSPELGEAASTLAQRMRMARIDQQGHPVAGGRVRLLIRFIAD